MSLSLKSAEDEEMCLKCLLKWCKYGEEKKIPQLSYYIPIYPSEKTNNIVRDWEKLVTQILPSITFLFELKH